MAKKSKSQSQATVGAVAQGNPLPPTVSAEPAGKAPKTKSRPGEFLHPLTTEIFVEFDPSRPTADRMRVCKKKDIPEIKLQVEKLQSGGKIEILEAPLTDRKCRRAFSWAGR